MEWYYWFPFKGVEMSSGMRNKNKYINTQPTKQSTFVIEASIRKLKSKDGKVIATCLIDIFGSILCKSGKKIDVDEIFIISTYTGTTVSLYWWWNIAEKH